MVRVSSVGSTMGPGNSCGANQPLLSPLSTSSEDTGHMPITAQLQEPLQEGLNQEGLLGKLRSVVRQNIALRDTVHQNNHALRQQLMMVVRWSRAHQEERARHQAEVASLTEKIAELQQENQAIKGGKPAPPGAGGSQQQDKLAARAAQLEADVTLLKGDLNTSRGDSQRLQMERNHLHSQCLGMSQQLKSQQDERRMLEIRLDQKNQEEENKLHQEPRRPEKEQQGSTSQQHEELSQRNVSLQQEVQKLREELRRMSLKESTAEDVAARTSRNASNDTCTVPRDDILALRDEVVGLEKGLVSAHAQLADEKQTVAALRAQLRATETQLQDVRDKLRRNTNSEDYYGAKIAALNEQHDGVTAKLLSYEELLSDKNEQLSRLKRESGEAKARLGEVSSEQETISILRAQLEVYQGDFRAEREARASLASDREQCKEELRIMHSRYAELQDELTQANRYQHGEGEAAEANLSLTPPHSGQGELHKPLPEKVEELDEALFYCPKCNKSFTELRPLEEHVNACLDEN